LSGEKERDVTAPVCVRKLESASPKERDGQRERERERYRERERDHERSREITRERERKRGEDLSAPVVRRPGSDLGFMIWSLGIGVWGLGFRV
jgi:hypothetical protein